MFIQIATNVIISLIMALLGRLLNCKELENYMNKQI